jgi:hypothetical protein
MQKLISSWLRKLKPNELAAWRKEVREKHERANLLVGTRQVVRRRMFERELALVNKQYGGEPRKARRGIARTIANRKWAEQKPVAA